MTMIQHAGYQTIDLQTFIDFVENKPVDLPPRPLLLTFDDARADSWTGADGILAKLHFNAVMFVDVGRVDGGDPEYLTWPELTTMQDSGRWQLQLHSGKATHRSTTARDPTTTGRSTPTSSRARTSTAGATASTPTSTGARRRSPITSPPTGRSPSLPRTAATARTAPTTPGSPMTCSAGSPTATTPSSPRTSTRERKPGRTAARPDPGHPRHHRRQPARDAALRYALALRTRQRAAPRRARSGS